MNAEQRNVNAKKRNRKPKPTGISLQKRCNRLQTATSSKKVGNPSSRERDKDNDNAGHPDIAPEHGDTSNDSMVNEPGTRPGNGKYEDEPAGQHQREAEQNKKQIAPTITHVTHSESNRAQPTIEELEPNAGQAPQQLRKSRIPYEAAGHVKLMIGDHGDTRPF